MATYLLADPLPSAPVEAVLMARFIDNRENPGAGGEIRTLKHLFLKTGCYSNSHMRALWCTGKDLNLCVPLGETGLQPVHLSRAHAPVQSWRKVDESNAHRSSGPSGKGKNVNQMSLDASERGRIVRESRKHLFSRSSGAKQVRNSR
jgi:hypothetical protein